MFGIYFVITVGTSLAFGKRLPWSVLSFGLGRFIWTLSCLGLIGLFLNPRWRQRVDIIAIRIMQHRLWVVGLIALNIIYQAMNFILFKQFGYQFPWPELGLGIVILFILRPGDLRLAAVFNLAILVSSIFTYPINAVRSDMLVTIQHSLDQFALGHGLYAPFSIGATIGKASYLPLDILSHLPAWWLGLDLRWNQVLFRSVWIALLLWQARGTSRSSPWMLATQALLLHPYFNFRHDLYFDFFLCLLVAYWCLPKIRMFAVPIMIVTRQWAWIIAPFLILHDIIGTEGRGGRGSDRRRIVTKLLVGSGCALTIVYLGFGGTMSGHAVLSLFQGFDHFIKEPLYYGDYGFTLAPLAFLSGTVAWLPVAQAICALTLMSAAIVHSCRRINPDKIIELGVFAWALMLMLNFHYWNYFWISPLVFIIGSSRR